MADSFGNLFSIDMGEIDFNLEDFDLTDDMPDKKTRIIQPCIDTEILTMRTHYNHALEFATKIDLSGQTRTYAFVSGAFIFGEIIEALWDIRHVDIRRLYISTLSLSQENIDSWAGLMQFSEIESLDLILSAYFYSHERNNLIPYLYDHLDVGDKVQIAFGAYHTKIICIETWHGNTIVIHGSANARSSYNIEQIMVEVNQRELFDFNRDMIHDICSRYGTINHKFKPMKRKETFDLFRQQMEGQGNGER